jgi:hypothetical protein
MSNLDWYRQKGLFTQRSQPMPSQRSVPVFLPQADGTVVRAGSPEDRRSLPMQTPTGTKTTGDALQYWRGSRAVAESGSGLCPACRAPNYFPSMKDEFGRASVGHCAACGHRDHLDQAMSATTNAGNTVSLARAGGPTPQGPTLRGVVDSRIPVKQARQARQDKRSGGLAIVARYTPGT